MAGTSKIFGTILSEISKAAKMERTATARALAAEHGAVGFRVTNTTDVLNNKVAPTLEKVDGKDIIDSSTHFIGLPNKNGGYDIVPTDAARGGYLGTTHDYGGGRYFFDSDFKAGQTYSPDQMRDIVPASIDVNGNIVKKGSFSLYSKGNKMAEEAPSVSAPKPAAPPPPKPAAPKPVKHEPPPPVKHEEVGEQKPKINWSKVKKLVPASQGAKKAELDQFQFGRLVGETHDATHFQMTGHAVNGGNTVRSIRRQVVNRGTQPTAPQKTLSSEPVTNTASSPPVEQPVEIPKEIPKEEPVVEQPTEIPKEEPVVEQPRELPKEEPPVEQPVEIPKEPKPNSEPIIEPAPEEPHQSVYNPDNTPDSPKDVYRFKQSKHLDDFRIKNDSSVSESSVQSEVDAANPLGTQASREAETAEAQARMANQGGATGSHEEGGGFFNNVKSSITNLKATAAEKFSQASEAMGGIKSSVSGKFDEAMEAMGGVKSFASEKISHGAETLGGIKSSVAQKVSQAEEAIEGFKAKYSSTPTEFQQQTTEMVNKFSGGKYTGAVDTENMNWIEAGANKHLHKSVAQDYQNLLAKMQGAKDQEAFSKLMEETGINYKEGMSGAELEKNINAHFDKKIADGPGIGNYMLGNKVASGAMLTVSGASVLALSDSRGRRSNSDLYSSQI